jgi:hypothetical protein
MSSAHRAPLRPGNVTVFLIAFLIITVPALLLSLNVWRIVVGKIQQQRFCDAAVHAAAIELTSEYDSGSDYYSRLLYGTPSDIQTLCHTDCVGQAVSYAAKNYVDGVPLLLNTSVPQKDVKFGSYDFNAATPAFQPINPVTAMPLAKRSINAVRVEGFRTAERTNSIKLFGPSWIGYTDAQIVTRTTAALDRRVVGFRIQDNLVAATYQAIPLAPVAVLSESTNPVTLPYANIYSWEYQVERDADPSSSVAGLTDLSNASPIVATTSAPHNLSTGNSVAVSGATGNTAANGTWTITVLSPTTFSLDTSVGNGAYTGSASIVALTNPIAYHTMTVTIPTSSNGALPALNSRLLKIGTTDVAGMNGQLLTGITSPQMTLYKPKELILSSSSLQVNVPELAPPMPDLTLGSDFLTMKTNFLKLRNDKTERAWPLYTSSDGTNVVVTGFIAARIIDVTTPGDAFIVLTLRPTLLETPTAFTDYSNRFQKTPTTTIPNSGPPSPYVNFSRLVNPYICRVRLVD